jgi:hypothetical protein
MSAILKARETPRHLPEAPVMTVDCGADFLPEAHRGRMRRAMTTVEGAFQRDKKSNTADAKQKRN